MGDDPMTDKYKLIGFARYDGNGSAEVYSFGGDETFETKEEAFDGAGSLYDRIDRNHQKATEIGVQVYDDAKGVYYTSEECEGIPQKTIEATCAGRSAKGRPPQTEATVTLDAVQLTGYSLQPTPSIINFGCVGKEKPRFAVSLSNRSSLMSGVWSARDAEHAAEIAASYADFEFDKDKHQATVILIDDGDGWQDIESAPKDGTRIMTCCMTPKTRFIKKGHITVGEWDNGCWSGNNEHGFPATHWMPLPEPPKTTQGED